MNSNNKNIAIVFLLSTMVLINACMLHQAKEEKFLFGDRSVKLDDLRRSDIYKFLADDWEKFDKHATDASDFASPNARPVNWYMVVTPPFPTYWPPRKHRSITYYAYAEYQLLYIHGPSLNRSAPWAKVVLNEGEPAVKTVLSTVIGPVMHGEGSMPISRETADRKIQIIKDGEAHLSSFVKWTAIPDDASEVKAIREYYCQWALTDRTADLIKNNHRGFFEWLSCPPPTWVPVLQ